MSNRPNPPRQVGDRVRLRGEHQDQYYPLKSETGLVTVFDNNLCTVDFGAYILRSVSAYRLDKVIS
jgi:hypothetical protein